MAFPFRGCLLHLIIEMCWRCALAQLILIGTVHARLPAPLKTKPLEPPGLLLKPQGHLWCFPCTASGAQVATGQPREQTRSPKSEFQFSSATRRVHTSPPARSRGAQSRIQGQRQHTSGGGWGAPRTQQHIRRKIRQTPGHPSTRVQTTPGRSLQEATLYN